MLERDRWIGAPLRSSGVVAGAWPSQPLCPEHVALGVPVSTKRDVFLVVAELVHRPRGPSVQRMVDRLARREALRSTGFGQGAALPHAQVPGLRAPACVYLRPRRPIDFDAPDGRPVSDILALLVPSPAMQAHFELLQALTRLIADPALRAALAVCRSAHSVCGLFAEAVDVGALRSAAADRDGNAVQAGSADHAGDPARDDAVDPGPRTAGMLNSRHPAVDPRGAPAVRHACPVG